MAMKIVLGSPHFRFEIIMHTVWYNEVGLRGWVRSSIVIKFCKLILKLWKRFLQ